MPMEAQCNFLGQQQARYTNAIIIIIITIIITIIIIVVIIIIIIIISIVVIVVLQGQGGYMGQQPHTRYRYHCNIIAVKGPKIKMLRIIGKGGLALVLQFEY